MSNNYFTQTVNVFSGLDQRVHSAADFRQSPEIINFKIDSTGRLTKREGYSRLASFPPNIMPYQLWHGFNENSAQTLVAASEGIYTLEPTEGVLTKTASTTGDVTRFIEFANTVYALDGHNLMHIDANGEATAVSGYVPLIATACDMNAAGTAYESPNMLTAERRVQYSCNSQYSQYKLPEDNIYSIVKVIYCGEEVENYLVEYSLGLVTLPFNPIDGVNNLEIWYRAFEEDPDKSAIFGCTQAAVFANRLFLYGNPREPNKLYHSSLADGLPSAEYFSETDYHVFDSRIMDLVPHFNRLMIFFKNSASYTYAELQTDALGSLYTSFPVYVASGSKGNRLSGTSCVVDGCPITFSADGINRWVSTAVQDERNAKCFSEPIFKFVQQFMDDNEQRMRPVLNRTRKSELWLCADSGICIYNYQADVFYFYSITGIVCACEFENDVLLAHENGRLYLFSEQYKKDDGIAFEAKFVSPFISFGTPYVAKSLSSFSINLDTAGECTLSLELKRGNGSEEQTSSASLSLPETDAPVIRRLKSRLHLKRFMNCAFTLRSLSDELCVSSISLSGKLLLGDGNRLT